MDTFLNDTPSKDIFATFLEDNKLIETFIKFNTPMPSTAAVKRLFLTGKDVLRSKRAGLSDEHLQIMVFLKGNLKIY